MVQNTSPVIPHPCPPPSPRPCSLPLVVASKADAKKKQEEAEALKNQEAENTLKIKEMTAAKCKKMQALKEEHAHLGLQYHRNERLREVNLLQQ